MRADLESLFVGGEGAGGRVLFLRGAATAFVEGLHPEGFGDVGDGFGESVQGGGAGVEACGEPFPPRVEQRIYGVRGAATEACADFFNRGAFA